MAAKRSQKRLFERVFRKQWKDFTTNQIILAIGLIIAVATAAIMLASWLWPNGPEATRQVMIDANAAAAVADSNSAAMAVDGQNNVAVAPHGTYIGTSGLDPQWLARQTFEYVEGLGRTKALLSQSEREKEELKQKLEEAVQRAENLQAQGDDAAAAEAIRQYRDSGATAKLLEVLIRERERHRHEQERHQDERIKLNREIAAVAYLRGEIETAQQAVDEILAAEPNDLSALLRRGLIHHLQGRLAEAEHDYRSVLELAKDDEVRAMVLGNLGAVHRIRGDLGQAAQMHLRSLAINEQLGRQEGIANNYANLALVYQSLGDLDQAEQMHRKSLAINEQLGRREGMANNYANLGLVYRARGDLEQAEQMHLKALLTNAQLGRREGMATACGNLGVVYQTRGDLDQAEQMHRTSLAINEQLGCRAGIAIAYGNLGSVYKARGDLKQAREYSEKALELFTQVGMRPEMQKVQRWLAELEGQE